MIAELHNKINSSKSKFYDRSEDELTGNFFGSLRYIPFNKGIKQILARNIYPQQLAEHIETIDIEEWESYINFWPRYAEDQKKTELDVVIDFGKIVIGIEVKYLSELSSDDDVTNGEEDEKESCNQLAREARLLKMIGKEKEKLLILLADHLVCKNIYEDVKKRNIIDVDIGYISWQNVLKSLYELKDLNSYEVLIIEDLCQLLIKKGFKQFNDFKVDRKVEGSFWEFENKFKLHLNYNFRNKINKGDYYEFG